MPVASSCSCWVLRHFASFEVQFPSRTRHKSARLLFETVTGDTRVGLLPFRRDNGSRTIPFSNLESLSLISHDYASHLQPQLHCGGKVIHGEAPEIPPTSPGLELLLLPA